MSRKSKIAIAALVGVSAGLTVSNAFARRPALPTVAPSADQPSIAERTANMPVNPAISGTWTDLTNPFPGVSGFGPDTALLLNDGSVVMHEVCTSNWFRLLPDRTNSYINGNWSAYAVGDNSPISPMIGSGTVPDGYGPLFYASQALPDGRFIVNGGEYEFSNGKGNYCNGGSGSADSTKGSLYNPQTDTWTAVPPPIGWSHIGDASSIIIGPNKITGMSQPWSYMIADCCDSNPQRRQQAVATIAPIPTNTVTWTITGAGKADPNSEEGWTLLPNGQFLTVDTQDGTNSETFNPGTNLWRSAGNTPVFLGNNLGMAIVPEMGPAVMTGYGLVVQIGANPNTALFNPVTRSWTAGPTFPSKQETPDGPAALLPNGNILVQTSIGFKPPSLFWELGGETLPHPGAAILTPVANPPCGDPSLTDVGAFKGRMLVIPTGQILWDAGEGITCTSIYTPNPDDPASSGVGPDCTPWFPSISSISSKKLKRGNTYTIHGTVLNGISQGAMYGDDAQMATNRPMVRITNNSSGNVCYGRTHDFSAGVATGTSTEFDVPPAVTPAAGWALVENPCDTGLSTLSVVTNGIPSKGIAVTIQ